MKRAECTRLRVACVSCTAVAVVGMPQLGSAQDRSNEQQIEAVVVTGSRVRGAQPVGSNVNTLGREQIEDSSAVTIDRILQELPQVFDLGVSENSRAQSGGAGNIVYNNSVNLRGLGPYATLVLIDGHRMVNNSRSSNPSVIPTLGVERIEVIADGASAVYGSDAVAGVVNVIPRRNLDGAEVATRYGASEDGAFDEWRAGVALGKVWTGGQAMIAYDRVYRSNLNGDDRDFFAADQRRFGGPDYRVAECAPGTIIASGTTYAIPPSGLANASQLTPGTQNLCSPQLGQDLFPESEYDSANVTFTQDLNPWLTVSADGFYSKRDFKRQPAHSNSRLTVPRTNAFFVAPAGFTGDSYQIDYNFMNDFQRDTATGYAESWEITPKLQAELGGDWQFETLLNYGRTDDNSIQTEGISNAELNAALASSDPATAFDPYGLGRTSAAVIDRIQNQQFIAPTKTRFIGYEARANGSLFNVPGGAVRLAAGYEGQELTGRYGGGFGVVGNPVTYNEYSRRVDSFYAEVLVPIFSAANAATGLERLELSMAVRNDEYSDVGSTTNPKFGLSWSPLPGLTLRGSHGKSFRAPLLFEVAGGNYTFYIQPYADPAGGPPVTGFTLAGANRNLKPEKATSWSFGADWEPSDRLTLSATYFNVEYNDQIVTLLSNLTLLARESDYAGTGIIARGSQARDLVLNYVAEGANVAGVLGDPNNINLFVDGRPNNLGASQTEGVDIQAVYRLDTQGAGAFAFNLSGTYLTNYSYAVTDAAPDRDRLNYIFEPLRFKARASVAWSYGDVRLRAVAHHVAGYTNDAATPRQRVSSYTPVDFSADWNLGSSSGSSFFGAGPLVLGFEINNAFDTDPPYVQLAPNPNGSGGYDATASNPIGRRFAISLRKSF